MPEAARIAQAQALEVPVILQGAKTADETGKRELFTENATTTLVFENGAVLNLRSKLVVGQAIFIHNKQNGREILCKVLEAPAEGQAGYTDLEFTTADPEFWHVNAQQPETSAQNPQTAADKPDTNEQPAAPAEDTLAMMSESAPNVVMPATASLREELVPAHEMIPETAAAALVPAPTMEPTEATEPTGEQIDAVLRQMSGALHSPSTEAADASPHQDNDTGHDHPEDEKHLSALIARDARLAKHAAIKEKQVEKIQRDAAAKDAPGGAPVAEAVSEQEVVLAQPPLMDRLTTGKNAIIIQVVAWMAIAVAIGFIWHAMRGVFVHDSYRPVAAAVQPKPKALPTPKPISPAPAHAVAATTPATTAASSKVPQSAVTQAMAAPAAKVAPAKAASAGTGRVGDARDARIGSAGPRIVEHPDAPVSDTDAAQPMHRRSAEASSGEIVPARILSQPQPSFPSWANGLDLDGVVTLDAVIDEKGNVTTAKPLSGPRPLQRAAEQAVGLWEFEPARSGGKPIASHMTLTVEFKR